MDPNSLSDSELENTLAALLKEKAERCKVRQNREIIDFLANFKDEIEEFILTTIDQSKICRYKNKKVKLIEENVLLSLISNRFFTEKVIMERWHYMFNLYCREILKILIISGEIKCSEANYYIEIPPPVFNFTKVDYDQISVNVTDGNENKFVMNINIRDIYRWIKTYNEQGDEFYINFNRLESSWFVDH